MFRYLFPDRRTLSAALGRIALWSEAEWKYLNVLHFQMPAYCSPPLQKSEINNRKMNRTLAVPTVLKPWSDWRAAP